jgi:hypothetical protein
LSAAHETQYDRDWTAQARSRLALRRWEKPATKAGQIRALWPDIEAALAAGQSMKTICAWLAEDAGITVGVTSLTSYISRIRRRERVHRPIESPVDPVRPASASNGDRWKTHSPGRPAKTDIPANQGPRTSSESGPDAIQFRDPLANLRAGEAKRPGFNYRPPTLEDEKKLI